MPWDCNRVQRHARHVAERNLDTWIRLSLFGFSIASLFGFNLASFLTGANVRHIVAVKLLSIEQK